MVFAHRASTPGDPRKSQQHRAKVGFNDWSCGLGDSQLVHAPWDGEDTSPEGNAERS